MANGILEEQQYWAIQSKIDSLSKQFSGLSQNQIRARAKINPAAAELLQLQEEQQGLVSAPSGIDKNPVTDFLGNLAWSATEELTLGATLGFDIASGGELKKAFGVQDWEDNSWMGRLGGAIGQGAGFVGSVMYGGAALKGGAKALNKVAGLGTKALTRGGGKKIRSETGETLSKIVGDKGANVEDFAEELYQAGRSAIKTGNEKQVSFFGRRKAKKIDPFETFDLQTEINKNFDDILKERLKLDMRFSDDVSRSLLDPANEGIRTEIRNSALKTAREFAPGNIPRQLAGSATFQKLGNKWSQIASDMAYEAALLGTHGGLRNLSERVMSAVLDLNDENYGRRSFASDVLHGAMLGGALAPVRYIKGGAAVEWHPGRAPKAGVTANMTQAATALIRKMSGKKATDYSPRQLQVMLRNIWFGSNKNAEFFRKIDGWTPLLVEDPRMLESATNVKALQRAYAAVSEDVSKHLIPMLIREVGRDLGGSWRRYTTGSIVMNGTNWYNNWDLYKDDPARLISDYIVGAFYMKRGKTLDGATPAKRFLGPKDINGHELADLSKAFDVFGWDKGMLDYMAGTWDKMYEDHIFSQNIIEQANKSTPDLRNASKILEKDMVPVSEFQSQTQDPNLSTFESMAIKEYTKFRDMANSARDAGDSKAALSYQTKADAINSSLEVAKRLVKALNFGIVDKRVRAMTQPEALEFINRVSDIEINGKKVTIENAEKEVMNLRKSATYKITGQMQTAMEHYIKSSLDRLGLWDPSMETDGSIIVHPSVQKVLLRGLSKNENTGKYSDAVMTLNMVLELANRTGIISFSDRALAWTGRGKQHYSVKGMESLLSEYTITTERMHDLVFNTQNSGWRDEVPYKNTTNEFLDKYIIASEPLWKALEVNQLHMRNDVGMHILTGEGMQGTEHTRKLNELLNGPDYFEGHRELQLSNPEDPSTVRKIGDKPWLVSLLKNINKAWAITQGGKAKGVKPISIEALDNLHEQMSEQVGNLFTNDNNFTAFKRYLDKSFVDSMLGSETSYGAKRAINALFEEGHPLSFQEPNSNRRVIASAKAIEREILGSEYGNELKNADPEFVDDVRKMIERYKTEIEDPTKGKGDYIEYSDKLTIEPTSQATAKEWMQALVGLESSLDATKISELSRVTRNLQRLESMAAAFNTAAHWDALVDVATKKTTVAELRENMNSLLYNSRELAYIIRDGVQNNDFLLIRQIADRQRDIERAIDRAQAFTVNGKGSLEEVSQTLYKLSLEAVNERNRKLNLDSIESVDEFIKQQTELVTRQDATGRLVVQTQTMSEPRYKSRYNLEQTSIDYIKGDLLAYGSKDMPLTEDAAAFLNSHPTLKDSPQHLRSFLEQLEQTNVPVSDYMSQVVKPWLEYQWTQIQYNPQNKNRNLTEEQFKSDTYQMLVTAMAQKKIAMGNYENGLIHISNKAVTNWDVGFMGMIEALELQNRPGAVMLFGESTIAGNRIQTRVSATTIQEINANLAAGVSPKVSQKDIFSSHENEQLAEYLSDLPLTGQGQDGRPTFQIFRLDSKQAIILSADAYHHVVNKWRMVNGPLRQKLNNILGEDAATRYLTDKIKLEEVKTDADSVIDKQKFTTKTVEELLLLTRLMNDNAYYLDQYVTGKMSRDEVFSALKYLPLANPRGGITLNEKTLGVMSYVTKELMPDTPTYKDMKRHFNSNMNRDQKQLTIYDEKDPLNMDSGFNSDRHNREILKKQLMEDGGLSEQAAVAKAEELAAIQRPEAKSMVDAEVYLTLPEMAGLLVSRGADRRWFVWDGDKIVGFNVVIKPVVSQNKVNSDGSISVVVDKTAYKFDPTIDKALRNQDGTYFADALAFRSANKVNQSRDRAGGEWTENIISLDKSLDVTQRWKPQVVDDVQLQRRQPGSDLKIVDIDRKNIMIKSISGEHDGTLSMAWGNYLSNSAEGVMGSWLKSSTVVSELNQHMLDLYKNPFAFRAIGEKLKEYDMERGDITASLTGMEAVLAEGGLPIFDHMRPQLERALVGNYLGSRNFASGRIVNGAYNTMTAADGLSLPIKEGGIQSRLGGSGLPFFEYNKSVRDLLKSTDGTESMSLVFRLSPEQANNLNTMFASHPEWKKLGRKATEVKHNFFRPGDEIIASGNNTVSGPFEGHINAEYGFLGEGGRNWSMTARRVAREVLLSKGYPGDHYSQIIDQAYKLEHADGKPKIESLGEFVRFVDGNPLSAVDRQNSKTHLKDYDVTNGIESMAKTIDPRYSYQSIRVLDNNMRTPKDGLNSWVLTGVEKLIDRRRGPVHEMNSSDAINPQDADFDLDKSASFFGTPAPIVKEISAVSGYHALASEQLWDRALMEVPLDRNSSTYMDDMKKLEAARPLLLRQHTIASAMYQYFTSLDGLHMANRLKPGYKTGTFVDELDVIRTSESVSEINVIADFKANNGKNYKIMFKHGAEFVDALGYMKSLIKMTLDIHGDIAPKNERNVRDAFWFSDEVGLFKVVEEGRMDKGEKSWESSIPEIDIFKNKIVNDFLEPLSKIFNLGLGTETLSDGTSRKLTFYDYVSTFRKAKSVMEQGTRNEEGRPTTLSPFLNNFLGFLGDAPGKAGVSKHPLIEGLLMMSEVENTHFPNRIDRGNELANMLNNAPMTLESAVIQKAIDKYMGNEKQWAKFSHVQWEINQLEDILTDMRARRQQGTSQYTKMQARKDMLTGILSEVEIMANDKLVSEMTPKSSDSPAKGVIADTYTAIYTLKEGKIINAVRVRKGDSYYWKKGQIVQEDPRTFRNADPIQQKHLSTMARAFGTPVNGVSSFDALNRKGYITGKVEALTEKFREIDVEFSDAIVKKNSHWEDVYTKKLVALKDAFDDVMSARGAQHAKQLIYNMLRPRINPNEMTRTSYDNKYDSFFSAFRFYPNKTNEQVALRFMTAAMDQKVPGLGRGTAREWWKEMMQAQKISYLLTHDHSLAGNAFRIGNMNRGFEPKLSVLPETEVKPRFLDAGVRNESALETIQAFMTGSYFLDPIELYRLTVGLDKANNQGINPANMGERVARLWHDVGVKSETVEMKEDFGKAVYRIARSSVEGGFQGSREHIRRKTFSEKVRDEINCKY